MKGLWILFMPPIFYVATGDWIYTAFGVAAGLFFYLRTNAENDDYCIHGFIKENDTSVSISDHADSVTCFAAGVIGLIFVLGSFGLVG